MEEESTNPATLADSAAAMKNMTPQGKRSQAILFRRSKPQLCIFPPHPHPYLLAKDMEKLISEMENMPEAQKAQLKDMGMDPDTSE
jgi:hypothetical protein